MVYLLSVFKSFFVRIKSVTLLSFPSYIPLSTLVQSSMSPSFSFYKIRIGETIWKRFDRDDFICLRQDESETFLIMGTFITARLADSNPQQGSPNRFWVVRSTGRWTPPTSISFLLWKHNKSYPYLKSLISVF